MFKKLAAAIIATFSGPACAEDAPRVCSAPEHRQFDFWIGHWQVADASGQVGGENHVTLEEGGCVLIEHWRNVRGNTGQSYNYFDPATGLWKQRWVGLGLILEMEGKFENGVMTLEGPLHNVPKKLTTRLRGTWTLLPDGRVRQYFVESTDGGRTWADWFDGYYSKMK